MAEGVTKNLTISITVDPSQARQQAHELRKFMLQALNFSAPGFDGFLKQLEDAKRLVAEIQQMGGKSSLAKTTSPKQVAEEVKEAVALTRAELEQLYKWKEGQYQKDIQLEREKNAVLLNEQRKLYAQLAVLYQQGNAARIRQATQNIITGGLMPTDVSKDMRAYYNSMAKEAEKASRAMAKAAAAGPTLLTGEVNKLVSTLPKYHSAMKDAIRVTGLSGESFSKLGTKDLMALTKSFDKMAVAAKTSAGGLEAVNKYIKNVQSGVMVKGQGKPLGLDITEKDIAVLDKYRNTIPALNQALSQHGIVMDQTHGKLGRIIASTKEYMKFQMNWFLGAGTIFAVVGTITTMAKASMEFAQTLKNIQAVTGATADEIDLVADAAKRVARETPVAAAEAAKMGLQLIRAGLDAKEAASAMEVAAKIAVVSGEDAKVVADTVATAIMAWKLGAEGAEKVGNTLAAALNFSKLTIQDLGTAFNYAAGVASSFGRSLEETTSILAVYSNLGVRASTIATGWTQLMSELIAPSRKATEYLTSLTNKTTGLKLSIAELNPMTHRYADILKKLEGAGFDAAKAMEIFQVRAGRSLLFALRAGSAEFDNMQKKVEESKQLQAGLARVMEGPIAAFKRFWNQVQLSALEIGIALTPAIVALGKTLGYFASTLYHIVHLFTTLPGGIILVVGALLKLEAVVNSLRRATSALLLLTGGWIKLLAIIGGMVAGVALDKILFGESGLENAADMKSKLDENTKSLRALGSQYGETSDQAVDGIDDIKKRLDELTREAKAAYVIPVIKVSADITDAQKKFDELIAKSKELGRAIKDLESKILTAEMVTGARQTSLITGGQSALGKPSKLPGTGFNLGIAQQYGAVLTPPMAEIDKLNATHWGEGGMKRMLQNYKDENEKASKEMLALNDKMQTDALKRLRSMVSRAVKDTGNELREFEEQVSKDYVVIANTKGVGEAEKYLLEAARRGAELRDKASKEADKDLAKLVKRLNQEREAYKDHLDALKKFHEEEIAEIEQYNAIRAEAERFDSAVLEASLRDQAWLLDTSYKEEISDALLYYNEKKRILGESLENELSVIKGGTERQLNLLREQYSNASDLWDDLASRWGELQGELSSAPVGSDAYKNIENQIRDVEIQMDAAVITSNKLAAGWELAAIQGGNKLTEASMKAAEALRKLNYEQIVAASLNPLKQNAALLSSQKEYNQLLLEANELAGNWHEADLQRIELLKLEQELALNNIEQEKVKLLIALQMLEAKTAIAFIDGRWEAGNTGEIEIERLKKQLGLWNKIGEATGKAFEIKEADLARKTFAPVEAAIHDLEKEWDNYGDQVYQLSKQVYGQSAQAFSDLFYDAVTGQLKSLKDYFKSVFESILRYFSDLLGRMATQALAKPIIVPVMQTFTGTGNGTMGGTPGPMDMEYYGGAAGAGSGPLGGLAPYAPLLLPGMAALNGNWGGAAGGVAGFLGSGMLASGLGAILPSALMSSLGPAVMTAIFSAVPVIGTAIGMLIGTVIGDLFKNKPDFGEIAAGYKPGGTQSGVIQDDEWRRYSTGQYTFSTNMSDNGWPMSDADMKKVAEAFQRVGDNVKDVLDELGMDVSGFAKEWSMQIDLEGLDAEGIQKKIKQWLGDFLSQASNIDFSQWQKAGEDIVDTIDRVLTAIKSIDRFGESIDTFIRAIQDDYDAIAKWKDQIAAAEDNIDALGKSLDEATDPSDALNYANQLKQAIYEKYMAEKQMVMDLVNTISQLEMELTNFQISMQQKIDGLTGSTGAVDIAWNAALDAFNKEQAAGTSGEKLQYLQQVIGYLDQWVDANISAIQQMYDAQKEAIQGQIDGINKQIDLLNEQKKNIGEQISKLQEQLNLAQQWGRVLESVKKMILDMKTSLSSPRDVFERMGYLKGEIQRVQGLYAGATGEDKVKYAEELQGLIGEYLKIAQEAYQRPSPEYQAIYNEIMGWLESIQKDAESQGLDEKALLAQIKALEEQSKAIDEQIEAYQKQIVGLNEQMAQLDKQMQADIEAFKKDAAKYYEWAKNEGVILYQEKINELKDKLGDIVGDLGVDGYLALKQQEAVDALLAIKDILIAIKDGFINSVPNNQNVPANATGGTAWWKQLSWVAEHEPEDIVPHSQRRKYADAVLGSNRRGGQYHTMPITVAPNITIIADRNIDENKLAQKVEDVCVTSIKSGKLRKAVREVIA